MCASWRDQEVMNVIVEISGMQARQVYFRLVASFRDRVTRPMFCFFPGFISHWHGRSHLYVSIIVGLVKKSDIARSICLLNFWDLAAGATAVRKYQIKSKRKAKTECRPATHIHASNRAPRYMISQNEHKNLKIHSSPRPSATGHRRTWISAKEMSKQNRI